MSIFSCSCLSVSQTQLKHRSFPAVQYVPRSTEEFVLNFSQFQALSKNMICFWSRSEKNSLAKENLWPASLTVNITKKVATAEQNTDSLFQMRQCYILHEKSQFWLRLGPPFPQLVKGLALKKKPLNCRLCVGMQPCYFTSVNPHRHNTLSPRGCLQSLQDAHSWHETNTK